MTRKIFTVILFLLLAVSPLYAGDLTMIRMGGTNWSDVSISGGSIDSTAIGATTPSTGDFTTLTTTGDATIGGTVTGGTARVEVIGSSTLTDAQVRNTIVSNYGMAAGGDTTLPAYAGSTMFTIVTEAASQAWSLKPPSGELFTLDGTALDANDEIDVGQVAGNKLTFVRIRTGAATYRWDAHTITGTHTDGGAS